MDDYPVNLKDDDEKDEDDSSWGFRVGIDTEFKLDNTAKGKVIASDGWHVPISMAKRLVIARDELRKLKVDYGFVKSSVIDYIKWGGDVNQMIDP